MTDKAYPELPKAHLPRGGFPDLYTADQLAAAVAAGPENDMQYLVDEFEKSLPPMGHPLRKLGVRLTELLDEDQWAECERLLLEGWEHDAADRATGARWRANSSLEEWFPYTHEELARLRETLQGIADADWRHGQLCRVLAVGRMNSALVEFEDGTKVVTSRYAVRKLIHNEK